MAVSNRDRIDQMFQVMAPALDDFISLVIGQADSALGADWVKLVKDKDARNGAPAGRTYDPLDPQVQFRILTETNITSSHQPRWYPFKQSIGRSGRLSPMNSEKCATPGRTTEPSATTMHTVPWTPGETSQAHRRASGV